MATLNQSLAQQVDENLGMAMIYVLVSAAQEWLREKASSPKPRSLHCSSAPEPAAAIHGTIRALYY